MAHAPVEHVGDGLEAAVRVVREAGDVVLRPVGAELVQHQEGVEFHQLRRADHARQLDAGAVRSGHAADTLGDRAGVH